MAKVQRILLMIHINKKLSVKCALLAVIFALCGCTTSFEISYVNKMTSKGLDESFKPVKNKRFDLFNDKKILHGDIWLVELKSRSDLVEFVKKHEMAFLYYRLTPCEKADNITELLIAPIFINGESVVDEYTFYAPISKSLKSEVREHLDLLGKKLPNEIGGVCISLGAGNMLTSLETNKLRLEWLKL